MRKLAWFAVFFAAAALFILWMPEASRVWLWSVPVLAAAGFLLLWRRPGKGKTGLILCTGLLGLAAGCVYVLLWQGVTEREIGALAGKELTVEATVLEDSTDASYGLRTDVQVGRLRCRLFTGGSARYEAGQKLRVKASFQRTVDKTNSDYYLTLGVPLFAYARGTPEVPGEAEAGWRFLPAKVGRLLRDRIRHLYDRDSAAFLLAILTGDRSELRRDVCFSSMLRVSGVSHSVAISGMHLSFLVMFLYVLLGRGKLSALVCVPVTLLFMAMTGFTASVIRAGVMQLMICGAKLFRREYDSLSALGLALLILVCLNPYGVRSAGLLLSFSSTLGILLFYTAIRDKLPEPPKGWGKHSIPARLWHGLRATLSVSLAASILTVPLQALFFRQISLLAPLTNILVLWAVSLCFSLGLLGTLLSFLFYPAGQLCRYPLWLLVSYIRLVTGCIGRFPLASLYIRSAYLPCWLAVTWACMGLYRFLPGLRHRALSFAVTAGLSLALFLGLSYLEPALDTLRFCVLDVGQGQCLALTAPTSAVMIDCGGSLSTNAGDLAAEYLLSIGRFRLDTLVLTHFHQDHVNGVEELMERIPVDVLYCPRPEEGDEEAFALLDHAESLGIRVYYVEDNVLWLRKGGLELALVPPVDRDAENESGLCVAAKQGEFSMLCTGDAGTGTELRLLERLHLENLTLLIAGHHGSAGSVSEALLEAAQPRIAAVSVGRNSYGLPAEKTLARLRAHGAVICRTDENGDIILRYGQEGSIWVN